MGPPPADPLPGPARDIRAGGLEAAGTQACNGSRYLKVSKEQMALLRKQGGCRTEEDGGPGPTVESQSGSPPPPQPASGLGWQDPDAPGPADGAALLPAGTRLRVEAVPPGLLSREEPSCFYCCSQCGKVFWEGSHMGRLVSQFRELLAPPEES